MSRKCSGWHGQPTVAVRAIVVTITALVAACSDPPSAPTTSRPQAAITADPVLVGAGDIAECDLSGDETTASLLDGISGTVATFGDNVYENGTATEFANCYNPSWGRHKARTRPSPGNHDYNTSGASGYYGYFGSAAGPSSLGYYSYDLGTWHVVSLNSNVGADNSSAQMQWLRADLAAHPTACTVAYWHHPVFSSGDHGNNSKMAAIWRVLDSAEVDLVLVGHDHDYERFAPQTYTGVADARGIRQFVVGTGGTSLRAFGTIRANSEVRNSSTLGVLKLTLRDGSYDWEFVPQPGASFRDAGSAACVTASGSPPPPPANSAPVARVGGPYGGNEGASVSLSASGSTDADGDALTYAWAFGDGTTGSGATVTKRWADDGGYTVSVVVTDPDGASSTATTTATIANVSPSATLSAPSRVRSGATFAVSLTNASDPSPADVAAGFGYAFDCGSGYGAWGSASSASCVAPRGTRSVTIRASVRDKDLGAREYTASVRLRGHGG